MALRRKHLFAANISLKLYAVGCKCTPLGEIVNKLGESAEHYRHVIQFSFHLISRHDPNQRNIAR